MQKEAEPAVERAGAAAPASDGAPSPRTHPKLWGALLVADSILVIVFGGALAAKIYQHLSAPAIVTAAPAAHRRPVQASAPAVEAPKPAPPPLPMTAKAPEPAPAAPTAGPKAAKPSLLAEPMKGRATPKAQAAGPASAPAPAAPETVSADKRHSIPVEFKLKVPHARSVHLAGAFIVRGGRREMVAQDEGVWTLTLYLLPGIEYRYWFLVNGKKTLDPENSQVERGASVLVLP